MPTTFTPLEIRSVPASPPHPPGTEYRIAAGLERWGDDVHPVVKIQVARHGKVVGRQSPSFPLGTDDVMRVTGAVEAALADGRAALARLGGHAAGSAHRTGDVSPRMEAPSVANGTPAAPAKRLPRVEKGVVGSHRPSRIVPRQSGRGTFDGTPPPRTSGLRAFRGDEEDDF